MSVWDDAYGISVPQQYHTTKGSISKMLAGLQRNENEKGFEVIRVNGWDYAALVEAYVKAEKICREEHVPVLMHVDELTQPQGHSTSGSHERYKSKERLEWEAEFDCIKKMRAWIIDEVNILPEELDEIEKEAKKSAKDAKEAAWKDFQQGILKDHQEAILILKGVESLQSEIPFLIQELEKITNPIRLESIKAVKKVLRLIRNESSSVKSNLVSWLVKVEEENAERYNANLYSRSEAAAIKIPGTDLQYDDNTLEVDGREIMQACFDAILNRNPLVFAIGEDVGKIGDVNQGFAGLQEKYGEIRVTDTGIRECTIIGQGIGAALRGLRPIAEIQYLDYLFYALQILSDDLACLQYRTAGGQKAPLIIRTRGHRLEGVWHSGSPIGMILHSLRGIHVLVPRNMTQAAGFYNTMLLSDEPALIIECLNGYRLKEKMPSNLSEYTVALGVPEILKHGNDVTIVTYGSMCRIVMEAALELEQLGINCEVIDVQTLLPFDRHHTIVESVKKTNRLIVADEDVPGGASAFILQKVLEEQNAYQYLDSAPVTIAAKEHRPAYSSDGDYFSKPNVETIIEKVYAIMREANPDAFPALH
jgi:pyruvate/2-oxoglutarate/acetoin dehydrogenase E1 component